jgi:hypothetical protein
MLQRIQSVYLLLAAGLMLAMLFLPVASFYGSGETPTFIFKAAGIYSVETGKIVFAEWVIFGLISLTAFVSIFTVFLFKKRQLQIKLTQINCILIFLIYVPVFVYGQYFISGTNHTIVPGFSIAVPLISIIIAQLAVRNIRKDEKLVRSLDRIR